MWKYYDEKYCDEKVNNLKKKERVWSISYFGNLKQTTSFKKKYMTAVASEIYLKFSQFWWVFSFILQQNFQSL